MKQKNNTILEKMSRLEKDLQILKLKVILNLSKKEKKEFEVYKDKDIISEVRKVRKKLWNGKYSKTI